MCSVSLMLQEESWDIQDAIYDDNPTKLQRIFDNKGIDPDAPLTVSASCSNPHCHIRIGVIVIMYVCWSVVHV